MQWDAMTDREKDVIVAEYLFDMKRYVAPPQTEIPDWVRSLKFVATIDTSGGEPNPAWTTREGKRLYSSAVWPIHSSETLPRYTTDYNAVALVREEIARRGLQAAFVQALVELVAPFIQNDRFDEWTDETTDALFALVNATPDQQCRAALRAVGVDV